jgi:hypothetical protein
MTTSVSTKATAGTPFVWAKLVAGKKMDLKAVEEEEQASALKARNALNEKHKENQLREQLAKQKREAAFDAENKKRLAKVAIASAEREAIASAEREAKYSVENGHWDTSIPCENHTYRDIPKTVNAHALKFAQLFLHNFGAKLKTCTTLFELEAVFQAAYAPYALWKYHRAAPAFELFEVAKYSGEEKNDDRYLRLQEWMLSEEKEWNAIPKNKQHPSCAPWVGSTGALWIFVKNVNFVNFVKAIDEKSAAFEKGILRMDGEKMKRGTTIETLNMATPIEWTVGLEPFFQTYFREKAPCAAKKKRQEDEEDDLMFMEDCN